MSGDADGGISWDAQEDQARERADEMHEDEAAGRLYAAFDTFIRERVRRVGLARLLRDCEDVMKHGVNEKDHTSLRLWDFAESEGWGIVLDRIARAQRDVERVA